MKGLVPHVGSAAAVTAREERPFGERRTEAIPVGRSLSVGSPSAMD